jgi:hypothetical protein
MIFCIFWRLLGRFRPFYLNLNPNYFRFNLNYAESDWSKHNALVGAPQVSLFSCRRREFFF